MLARSLFNEQDKASSLLGTLTLFVLGKQNRQARKVCSISGKVVHMIQAKLEMIELKQSTVLSHAGRTPEMNISHTRLLASPRFFNY